MSMLLLIISYPVFIIHSSSIHHSSIPAYKYDLPVRTICNTIRKSGLLSFHVQFEITRSNLSEFFIQDG